DVDGQGAGARVDAQVAFLAAALLPVLGPEDLVALDKEPLLGGIDGRPQVALEFLAGQLPVALQLLQLRRRVALAGPRLGLRPLRAGRVLAAVHGLVVFELGPAAAGGLGDKFRGPLPPARLGPADGQLVPLDLVNAEPLLADETAARDLDVNRLGVGGGV